MNTPLFALSLIAALAALNRLDTILLFVPALFLWSLYACRSAKALVKVGAGFAVFLLWEAFSIIYYGFPFPNTYYAKLNTGLTGIEYARQGLLSICWRRFAPTPPACCLFLRLVFWS